MDARKQDDAKWHQYARSLVLQAMSINYVHNMLIIIFTIML